MDQTSSPDAPVEAKPRFWLGPLVAGCCFAFGYGITERVLTLQTMLRTLPLRPSHRSRFQVIPCRRFGPGSVTTIHPCKWMSQP